jgi:hypothetical protein
MDDTMQCSLPPTLSYVLCANMLTETTSCHLMDQQLQWTSNGPATTMDQELQRLPVAALFVKPRAAGACQ